VSRRLEVPNVPDELFEALEAARGDVPRSRFVLRALEAYVSEGAVKGVPSPARPVAEEAAAPLDSPRWLQPPTPGEVRPQSGVGFVPNVPGVARASSLVKRDVKPIPKGKGK
jgi:hypothetical protein